MSIKSFLFLFFLTLINFISEAQNTFIPDDNFEQALIDVGYDVGPLDDFVPTANINSIINLDISLQNISDLTGIEDFVALSILDCTGNQLTNLNLSQSTLLTELYCDNNSLTNIDVSQNTDLKIFWCFSNQLSNINVSQNTDLISLVCNDNQLTNLDITQNTSLNVLVCKDNQLTTIDVTNNTLLSRFVCGNNLLLELDISKNTNLSHLFCEQNQISILNTNNNTLLNTVMCFENNLTQLDFSQNQALINLNCSNNNLCSLNVNNGNNTNMSIIDFSFNTNLNCVVVDNPTGNHSIWQPISFSNYASSQTECNNFVNIDTLNNVITNNFYTLPTLTYGNYYTQTGGNGSQLNAGDSITSSQTIYIYNESVCTSNESNFSILITSEDYYIPKYFTPNNDGNHDFWKVQDFTNSIKNITIYNRHGKLLKTLLPNSQGWNGIFNGKLLASNDYWYTIILITGEALKGHFTLKR